MREKARWGWFVWERGFATICFKMGFENYGEVENQTGDGNTEVGRAMFYPIAPGARPPRGKKHGPPV